MQFIDYLRFIFCSCCQHEPIILSRSNSTQTNNLEPNSNIFKNDSDCLIPPGSSQVKYTFATEDSDDTDIFSEDSSDTYSSIKTNTSTDNNHDIMRSSFESNESWEMMIEDNLDNSDNIKYV